ncbi:hypothetical protein QBC32DRAFT_247697 [Pseudoneurospora amorphoporcata]|uniref:3'-5' exonuclease domain-containing protein n=1 Tax=Pseudoneurospora amorphoporcata TaxID=241081 RepID=A0AAN6NNT2_9PEZI|nr:hypothetical protein QBC32DRAFT_247697 [Pseudoneurospora amorphoporcata]
MSRDWLPTSLTMVVIISAATVTSEMSWLVAFEAFLIFAGTFVKLLLNTGKVDADPKGRYERTALYMAAKNSHEAVVNTQATSIIDVQTLGDSAFTTPGIGGNTLKAILEDPHTSKCFWDVRDDADALWAYHKVRLTGVTDVQLLENASRVGDKTYLRGLDKCVEEDLGLKFMEVHRWVKAKKEVQALMPNDIFARRPLDAKTMQYCVSDVVYLPALHNLYAKRITSEWLGKAIDESAHRVVEACGSAYEPQFEKKKFGPWGSGLGKNVLTMEKWFEKMEEDEADARERDTFGDDYGDYLTRTTVL